MNETCYRELRPWKYQTTKIHSMVLPFPCPDIFTEFIEVLDNVIYIRKGYAWDGASGPAIDTPSFMRGSLFHDALYQLMKEGHLPKEMQEAADDLMKMINLQEKMRPFRAGYTHWAVRTFGHRTLNKKYYPGERYVRIIDGKVVKT